MTSEDGIAIWTLNRPDTRNTVSEDDMVAAIVDAAQQANTDSDIRCVVLTAVGPAFSAGGNIKHMRDKVGMFGGTPAALREGYRSGIQRIPRALASLEIPIIAAVNGPAVGAGSDLAWMCDMRIASTDAYFAESFVRAGLVPGDGGAWLLDRIAGPAIAAEMSFTGESVSAERALKLGLVSRVVSPADLLPTALTLARMVARNSRPILRMTKRLLVESRTQTMETHLQMAAAMQAIAHHTPDHLEAVNALLERREPNFRN
ncbi:enoyl-CoA hydratase [Pseudarthrobacter sp. AB1]|nr:enoyl-CoA hydratase [Pseudarthrobacter sp. AB1]